MIAQHAVGGFRAGYNTIFILTPYRPLLKAHFIGFMRAGHHGATAWSLLIGRRNR